MTACSARVWGLCSTTSEAHSTRIMSEEASWRDYEREAAQLFERMGFEVSVGQTLIGARGKHNVDVVARRTFSGVAVTWIIECKLWKSPVQKAQVLTLIQVAQDVGADRAFLLSESGFQAGAIAVSQHTNVSLINLAELAVAAREGIAEASIKASLSKVKRIEQKLRHFLDKQSVRIPPPPLLDQTIELLGACFEVTLVTSATLAEQFPVRLPSFFVEADPQFTSVISTVATTLEAASEEIAKRTDILEQALNTRDQELRPALDALTDAVDQLLSLGTTLTQEIAPQSEDDTLKAALNAMRAISSHADTVREFSTGEMKGAVRSLMGELVDGAYVWLANPKRSTAAWTEIEKNTRDKVEKMSEAAQISRTTRNE